MIRVFEVQYDINNPDWYQTRVVEVINWVSYLDNVYNYKPQFPFSATIPREIKPENIVEGDKWLEFDFVVPSTGSLIKHKSWVIHFG